MIAWILLLVMQPAGPAFPTASVVEWTGNETWDQALQKLNQTGNAVFDGRAAARQPVTAPVLKLKPGKQTFWQAVDELCAQANLQAMPRNRHVELLVREGSRMTWIAYDGPWRARLIRRSLIAYDDPTLDRLLCQVELTLEPRYQPLLFTPETLGLTWPGMLKAAASPGASVSFDSEPVKTFEVRLPLPPRSVAELNSISLRGSAWLAPGRLTFTSPLLVQPGQTLQQTTFTINEIDVNQSSRTVTLGMELRYPEGSLEFESHQARLLSSMKLVVTDGKNQLQEMGRDIRTDTGRTVTARWFFRQGPALGKEWKAILTAPSAPQKMPVKLEFTRVALP